MKARAGTSWPLFAFLAGKCRFLASGFGFRPTAFGLQSYSSPDLINTPLQRGVVRARGQATVSTVSWLAWSDRAINDPSGLSITDQEATHLLAERSEHRW